jgi:endogenous inhibitor of DNA gyrase (YacG/DUF329 family)
MKEEFKTKCTTCKNEIIWKTKPPKIVFCSRKCALAHVKEGAK